MHIRWSCNTQAVSGFAKDWIEPIVDKFKLPVGIGELIGSCSTSGHCLQTFFSYSFDSLVKQDDGNTALFGSCSGGTICESSWLAAVVCVNFRVTVHFNSHYGSCSESGWQL